MKRAKKLLSLALVICMLMTVLPVQANAESLEITDYQVFLKNLAVLEEYAAAYAAANPGKDPASLTMKYIRTGVENYNSAYWNALAGSEDTKFAAYVQNKENAHNATANDANKVNVTGLKNLGIIEVPNGDQVDMGHVFAVMDVSYHNGGSDEYADAAGWAGDLVELMVLTDGKNVSGTLEEMVQEITDHYFLTDAAGADYAESEVFGDLDGYALVDELMAADYANGTITNLVKDYYTASQKTQQRAESFLANRMDGITARSDIRNAAFAGYTGNSMVASLEASNSFATSDLGDLRKACCYAFADYLCMLAGDYVPWVENIFYTVTGSEKTTLSEGITLERMTAESADGKQMVYHLTYADVSNPYVNVYVNYKDNDPSKGWGMQRVRDQVHAAEARHSDPSNADTYIPYYDVIVGINGAGYNMSTGEPAGLLMMEGIEYQAPDNQDIKGYGFFGILKDGSAIIGSTEEYYELKEKGLIMEGIDNFGATLVKDGELATTYWASHTQARETRTAVGITRTGKVVMMVLDGRQEPYSCGGSFAEIAQIMLDAGCVDAINLDGGGSSTMLVQRPGESDVSLANNPSDGFERSVSASMMVVSTKPSSDVFDHAVVNAEVGYLTIGATAKVTAAGVSTTGRPIALPEGVVWAVSDGEIASISADGIVTGRANGSVDVRLMLGEKVLGSKTMNVVVPDVVYFTQNSMNAPYGQAVTLPVAAMYQGKNVAITENDVSFTMSNTSAGAIKGFTFTGSESSKVRNVSVNAHAVNNSSAVSGSMYINMYKAGDATFDFEIKDGGDYELAWKRTVSNATTFDNVTYDIVDVAKPMVTDYTFAVDMTQVSVDKSVAQQMGASVEDDTNVWNLLAGLAQNVSAQTEISFAVRFDSDVEVDYSDLAVSNEYFSVGKTELNPETNELTVSLVWKSQSQAVDSEKASSVCILSGIQLTPKTDAAWDAKDRLSVANTGSVIFKVHFNGGAGFTALSKGIYDEYALNKSLKNGWFFEDGGYAYYVDGVKHTGVKKVGEFYYDFGENGINVGQSKYTGIFQISGVNHYAKNGVLTGGWITEGEDKYLFDENGKAVDGKQTLDEVEMNFDNGKLVSGYSGFLKKSDGKIYHYQNGEKSLGWVYVGEDLYHFNTETGVMTTGTHVIPDKEASAKGAYYDFAEDGRTLRGYFNGYGYYYWAGLPRRNDWVKSGADPDPDAWYHTNENGHYVTTPNAAETFKLTLDGKTYTAVKIAFDGVVYTFDNATGKLLLGSMVLKEGKWYYYWAGKPVNEGWFQFEDKNYYAYKDGHLATGAVTIDGNHHMFTPQGNLINGGIQVQVTLSAGNRTMGVKLVNADENMTSATLAIWAANAGQEATLQWIDLEKSGDKWVAEFPMCTFGVNKTDSFELHVYGVVDGTNGLVVNTSVDHMAPAEHTFEHGYDYKCDFCGETRTVDMTREMRDMYRMYDPNGFEHFYTGSTEERDFLVEQGWHYEGIGFTFPLATGLPVYRLYDRYNTFEHLYTMDEAEKNALIAQGWVLEGIAFNSAFENEVPQYRLHNPNATRGAYHFTASIEERDYLISLGWEYQGIGWYSMGG